MLVAVVGIGLGVFGAWALSQFLASLLFNLAPTDPPTFIAVTLLMAAVAALACYLPARRGTRVSPVDALRYE